MAADPATDTPSKPNGFKPISLTDLYTLYYRKGQNPFPMQKNFHSEGGLTRAIQVGKDHCERITARFLRVNRFISDLNKEENDYLALENEGDRT